MRDLLEIVLGGIAFIGILYLLASPVIAALFIFGVFNTCN